MRIAPRTFAVVAALLLLTPGASAQTATADVPPGASMRLDVMGPARVTYSDRRVVIDFDPNPIPPAPIPPGPTPPPDPVPPTPPPDPPKPAWGPLDRIVILYESSALAGDEPIYADAFQAAITAAAPKDAGGWPRWRMWDKDTAAPGAVSIPEMSAWTAALNSAKALQGKGVDPVMYGFDAQGRIKTVPLKGLADAQAVDAVESLGGAVR